MDGASETEAKLRSWLPRGALALIGLLCITFGVVAYRAATTKSATFDEPIHFVGGFIATHHGDFRIDYEHPPLFKYWAMLAQPADALKLDPTIYGWEESMRIPWAEWAVTKPMLYRKNGPDPDRLLNRSRLMMTMLGVALAVTIAWWAWDLAGPATAVIATAFYCFDPNFLGHAPLVKNDVPLALVLAGMIFAVCRIGRRLTVANAIALALLCSAAPLVKLSGTFGIVACFGLLICRSAWREPWRVLAKTLDRFPQRFAAAVTLILFCSAITYTGIWACYRFRFSTTPDTSRLLDQSVLTRVVASEQLKKERGTIDNPSSADIEAKMRQPPLSVRLVTWANRHRLLPQTFLSAHLNLIYIHTRAASYLLGEVSPTGWWYYFPLAFAFKEPLATLAAITGSLVIGVVAVARRVRSGRDEQSLDASGRWYLFCIATMLLLYLATAMASARDVGLRHLFPIFPLIFLLVAFTLRRAAARAPRGFGAGVAVLLLVLVIEALSVTPDFIAYFNVACGGSRGGLRLLSDSNLDWGQDLILLREWQKRHPNVKLRFMHFGDADPDYYVTTQRFRRAELTAPNDEPDDPVQGPRNVFAISATRLQGLFAGGQAAIDLAMIRRHKPLEVLGGTIYLYPLPLRD